MVTKKRKAGRRRARNEGSVYQRESDGRWVATAVVGFTDAGRPKRKTFYGKTEKEAAQKKKAFEARLVKEGPAILSADANQTLGQYLDDWMKASTVKRSTRRRYEQLVKYRIKPKLGGYPLCKLDKHVIKNWLLWLRDQDAAFPEPKPPEEGAELPDAPPKKKVTVRGQQMAYRVLRTALEAAAQDDLIAANPIHKLKKEVRPRPPEPETRAMTERQAGAFLHAAAGTRYYPLFVTAIDTGMREGELFALTWDDVDLDTGTITVRRTLEELGGKLSVTEPKTKKSRRTIVVTPHTVAALRAHRAACPSGDLVFSAREGGYLRRPNLARRHYGPCLKRAGLPHFRFHELRHTSATLLLRNGEPVSVVSERLGHASVAITLKHYDHVLEGSQRHAAARMTSIFDKVAPGRVGGPETAPAPTTTTVQEHAEAARKMESVLGRVLGEVE